MKHSKMILEACVDSPESAEAAEKGGADRGPGGRPGL